MQTFRFNQSFAIAISLLLLSAGVLSSCSFLNFGKKAGTSSNQSNQAGQNAPAQTVSSLSGDWNFAFEFNKQATQGSLHIEQKGNSFTGSGQEGDTQFAVTNGQFDGQQLAFDKSYGPNAGPPVHYTGTAEMVDGPDYKGPWMHGSYLATIKGQEVKGDWEGQLASAGSAPGANQQAPASGTAGDGILSDSQQAPQTTQADDGHAPQLSGKWTCAYENNFKTIKSTMYLEQDGTKVTGHGVDVNTKEKFTIEKGWYAYPKLTLIRRYKKGKAGGAVSDRTLTFKADVKKVNDADYQGPYLSGKTQGGGAWEAQQVH